jgi:predicted transglutaminase-like cysteine proteinase
MFQERVAASRRTKKVSTVLKGSFIRAVARSIKSHKLGDLMVASGLINQGQLARALVLQEQSGEPLGKVLIREGYISAVHLYRKLAEQWCIKAVTAGLALMMQVAMPTLARADKADEQVRLAAAFSPAAFRTLKPEFSYPKLFGSSEIRSNDISAFTKWTSVMKRFEDQMQTQAASARVEKWKNAIEGLKGKPVAAQIQGVDDYINSVRYIEDRKNYAKSDYWATPMEFFSRGGDCEDFAIAKYASLRALGFSSEQMRVAIVQDKIKNIPHAILIVYTDEGAFVLDNQEKRAKKVNEVARYQPIFSLNSSNWWLHRT